MQKTQVPSLGGEDTLEKEKATHSSIFAWEIPWIEIPGGLQSMESVITQRPNNKLWDAKIWLICPRSHSWTVIKLGLDCNWSSPHLTAAAAAAKSLQSCPTLCDPMDCSCQAPLSMGFPRQGYWSGLPFPSPGDLPDPGIDPGLLHCRQILYHSSHQGSCYLVSATDFFFCEIQIGCHTDKI